MHRFYIQNIPKREGALWLSPEESRHAIKVLRIQCGELVLVFDAEGNEFEARISEIEGDRRAQIKILSERPKYEEKIQVHVAQGYLQKQKMDWVVEKGCEIGIRSFYPLTTEFSVVQPKQEIFKKIRERWQRKVREAAKQSGNVHLMEIRGSCKFNDLLNELPKFDVKFMFHPYESDIDLKQAVRKVDGRQSLNLLLLIGPEGGFSEREVKTARQEGVEVVSLGHSILRAETAFAVLSGIFKLITSTT